MQVICNFILKNTYFLEDKPLLMIMRVEKEVHKILKGFNGIFELNSFFSFMIEKSNMNYWLLIIIPLLKAGS